MTKPQKATSEKKRRTEVGRWGRGGEPQVGWVVEVERGEDHKHTKFTDDEIHNSLCIKRNLGEPNQKLESDGGRRVAGRGGL